MKMAARSNPRHCSGSAVITPFGRDRRLFYSDEAAVRQPNGITSGVPMVRSLVIIASGLVLSCTKERPGECPLRS